MLTNARLYLSGALALTVACGGPTAPKSTTPAPREGGPIGSFVLNVDRVEGTATVQTSWRGAWSELTFGENGNPNTNPADTIQAITTEDVFPGGTGSQGVCPANTECFTVELTNFTNNDLNGVYMGIDSIDPPTGRSFLAPNGVPAGVSAALGGRYFGPIDMLDSATRYLNFGIPDTTSYRVTGRFWGDVTTVIEKGPDLGAFWNPVSTNASYVYCNTFVAPATTVSSLGLWLRSAVGDAPDFRLEVWGANPGPDASDIVASTGTQSPGDFGALTLFETAVTSQTSPLVVGDTYFMCINVVGMTAAPGSWQVGGHTQNSSVNDNGAFWVSNDPAGVGFFGPFTPEMAIRIVF